MKYSVDEFYPTPIELLDKITKGFEWDKVGTVLEPSAGKGDIAEYVKEKYKSEIWSEKGLDIDCIEIDRELRSILIGKNFRVIHDNFLTFHTYKRYGLIIMNPPFSSGAAHLLKALDLQKDGGDILCILNAETIKNPYTNERKVLINRLKELEADIQYMENEFIKAERRTDVEIAVVKVCIPYKESKSFIFEDLKKKSYQENIYQNITDLVPNDFIEAAVKMYEMEVEAGIRLIQEYKAMSPYILDDLRNDSHKSPILCLTIKNESNLSTNSFVRRVRRKYWNALFCNTKFTGKMTSNLAKQYFAKVEELSDYDFSIYNIKCIQLQISQELVKGIEDCIIELFDKLSHQYSYSDEFSKNIHYYNGWKTNKAWYINKKVILPYMNAFSEWSGEFQPNYTVVEPLKDIEKALNYLDGGITESIDIEITLRRAEQEKQTKKIQLKYFYVTFYKKGTCHIEFINAELLKKLNIFGSQKKKWLPPGYGKKSYKDMTKEEREVVDDFEGYEEYKKTVANADYFIYNPMNSIKMIETDV